MFGWRSVSGILLFSLHQKRLQWATLGTSAHCSILGKKTEVEFVVARRQNVSGSSAVCKQPDGTSQLQEQQQQQKKRKEKSHRANTSPVYPFFLCARIWRQTETSQKLSLWSYSPPHARQPPRACRRARVGVSAVKRDMCLWSWTHQRGTACAPAGCCRTGTGCHRHHKCRVLKNHKAHRSVDSFVIGRKWIHLSIYEPLLCRTTAGSALSLTLFFFCNCFAAQKLQQKKTEHVWRGRARERNAFCSWWLQKCNGFFGSLAVKSRRLF